jgi:hypothetical protein
VLRRVVIDDNCVIPDGMVIGENHDEDRKRFYLTKRGVVLVTREMLEARFPEGAAPPVSRATAPAPPSGSAR